MKITSWTWTNLMIEWWTALFVGEWWKLKKTRQQVKILQQGTESPLPIKKKTKRRQRGKANNCDQPRLDWFILATNPYDLALEYCLLSCQDLIFCDRSQPLFPKGCTFMAGLVKRGRSNEVTKAFGSSTFQSNTTLNPWLCSLKERGFRGRHRCGVTMLSGNYFCSWINF